MTDAQPFPGPTTWHPLGFAPEMLRDSLGFILRLVEQHGPYVRFRLASQTAYLVVAPEGVARVLSENSKAYKKSKAFQRLVPLIGQGLLVSEGKFWQRQRRMLQPEFTRARVADFAPVVERATDRLIERWRGSETDTRDVAADLGDLTLDVVSAALFSADVRAESGKLQDELLVVLADADRRMRQPLTLPLWCPTQRNRRVRRALAYLDGQVRSMIESRRAAGPKGEDLLDRLLVLEGEDGAKLDPEQLRDEVITLFLAGYETTSSALSWTLYLLALHPEVAARCRAELGDEDPGPDDIGRLRYLKQVVDEAMRLYPPAWIFGREALEDDVLGGFRLPKGAWVLLSPWATHRQADLWEDPERFDPERFASRPARYNWFPFGGGPRLCIGKHFSLLEILLVLPRLLRRFELSPVAGTDVQPKAYVTLRPEGALPLRVRPLPGT